ncbi:AraC family transcriptional regulator [Rhodoplanes sp. SY1]
MDLDGFRAQARKDNPGIKWIEAEQAESFRSDIASFDLANGDMRSSLHAVSHTSALRLEAHSRDAVRLLVPITSRVSITAGSRARTIVGGIAGLAPHDDQHVWFSAGEHLTVRADPARVAEALRAFECDAPIDSILDENFLETNLPGLQDLVEQVRRLVVAIDTKPAAIVDSVAFRAAHEQLVVLGLAHVLAAAADPDARRVVCRNPVPLRRAEEYIRAHAEGHVDLVAMARHAGLSLRSLQILFRANHDCTIVQFIRRHRLTLARERLQRVGSQATVAEIARRSGFTHLGHFTAAYKEVFGEQPRQTRQRARRKPDP